MLLILQDPRRDLICMLGYALASGNLHAFEDYARVCVPMSTGEAKRRERDGKGRNSRKHFTLRLAVLPRERGLIFLFNPRNEIVLVKSTGIFLFATPFPLFLRGRERELLCDACRSRAGAKIWNIHTISTRNASMESAFVCEI